MDDEGDGLFDYNGDWGRDMGPSLDARMQNAEYGIGRKRTKQRQKEFKLWSQLGRSWEAGKDNNL